MGAWAADVRVVLTDLDNTLYDWLGFFGPSMRGLCRRLSELSGVDECVLYSEFKDVFSRAGSVEYTFALQELPSLRRLHPESDRAALANRYFEAIRMFQLRRHTYLRLYPQVREGLEQLRSWGIKVVAVSDAHRFQVLGRLAQLGISDMFDGVCCVADKPVDELEVAKIRRHPASQYAPPAGKEYLLPNGLRKPDKRVLTWLLAELRVKPSEAIYVGDSLGKDVLMAQAVGVYDCWSSYGTQYSAVDMCTLLRVTNWSVKAISAVDANPKKLGIHPSYVAQSFHDVVDLVTLPRGRWPRRQVWVAEMPLPGFEPGPESAVSGSSSELESDCGPVGRFGGLGPGSAASRSSAAL